MGIPYGNPICLYGESPGRKDPSRDALPGREGKGFSQGDLRNLRSKGRCGASKTTIILLWIIMDYYGMKYRYYKHCNHSNTTITIIPITLIYTHLKSLDCRDRGDRCFRALSAVRPGHFEVPWEEMIGTQNG